MPRFLNINWFLKTVQWNKNSCTGDFKNLLRKTVLTAFFHKNVLETVPKAVSNHQIFYKPFSKENSDFYKLNHSFSKRGINGKIFKEEKEMMIFQAKMQQTK